MPCTGDYSDIRRDVTLDRGRDDEYNADESRVDPNGHPTDEFFFRDENGFAVFAKVIPIDSYECRACGLFMTSWTQVEEHWHPDPECQHNDYDDYFERCGDCGRDFS